MTNATTTNTNPIFQLMPSKMVEASYSAQRIPRMQGNPLIEALPLELSDERLLESLSLAPEFHPEQRGWENHFRIQQIKSLGNFMVPLSRHFELARMLDAMMREGYVGRAPLTKEVIEKLQQIYDMQKAGKNFTQTATTLAAQDAAALIGPSGMGKTTTVRRHLSNYPRVVYHKDIGVTQVTYLHIDIASDGNSVKALAIAIISQLDQLLPDCKYHDLYLKNTGRTSTESLIYTVGRLMTIHNVGLLVADEVQNLCNAKKGSQTVMTELTTMCNTLHVPILFIGTNKAASLLSTDFRQARRSTGVGISPWTRMPRYDEEAYDGSYYSEWEDFIAELWKYQWVQTPAELTDDLLDTIYRCTQGILDLAIKLFAIAQVRAIIEGGETLTKRLLEQVYERDFKLLHESVEALAHDDYKTLARYADVAPTNLEEMVNGLMSHSTRLKARKRLSKPGDEEFVQRIAASAMALGCDTEDSLQIANEIEATGTAKDTVDALKQIHDKLKRPAPLKTPRKGKNGKAGTDANVVWPDFTERPDDYRQAPKVATENGTTVYEELKSFNMAGKAQELILWD